MYLYAVLLHMSNCIHFVADLAHILNYFLPYPLPKRRKDKTQCIIYRVPSLGLSTHCSEKVVLHYQ